MSCYLGSKPYLLFLAVAERSWSGVTPTTNNESGVDIAETQQLEGFFQLRIKPYWLGNVTRFIWQDGGARAA